MRGVTVPEKPLVRGYDEAAVLVAGGTSGVGLATAHRYLDAGVRRLAVLGRNEKRGEAARSQLVDRHPEAQVEFLSADAGDSRAVQGAVERVHELLGGLDVVVSSVASSYRPELLHRTA